MTSQPHGSVVNLPAGGMHGASHEVLGRLAVGGMAELYLARTTHADGRREVVVLKRILPHLAEDPDFVRMFRDEAFLAATLHHTNIVRVYDIGQDGDDYFFTMEYVHGENVRTLIKAAQKAQRPLPLHAVLQIGYGVCEGLHYAHEQVDEDGTPLNIVHRDVSPTNILVAHDGQVKIVDFGIAKAAAATHVTQAGMLKGKASYMSPEQCRAEKVDRRSDVFAIGILLYEMTTLTRLFRGENELAVMHKILLGEVDRPSGRVPYTYDPELERVVMRALDPEPSRRYATALELKQDLQRLAQTRRAMPSAGGLGEVLRQLCGQKPYPWDDSEEPEFEDEDLSTSTSVDSSDDEEDTHVNKRSANPRTVIPGAEGGLPDALPDSAADTTNRRVAGQGSAGQQDPYASSRISQIATNATIPAPGSGPLGGGHGPARGRTISPSDGIHPPKPRPFVAQSGNTLQGAGGGLGAPPPPRSGRTIKGPPGSAAAVKKPNEIVASVGQSKLPIKAAPLGASSPPKRSGPERTMAMGAGSKPMRGPGLPSSLTMPSDPPPAGGSTGDGSGPNPLGAGAGANRTMALTPEEAKQLAQAGRGAAPPEASSPSAPSWSPIKPDPDDVDEGARTIAVNRADHTMMAGSAHEGALPKGPMGWRDTPSADSFVSTQQAVPVAAEPIGGAQSPPTSDPLTSTQRTPASPDGPTTVRTPSSSFTGVPPGVAGLQRPHMRSPAPRPSKSGGGMWIQLAILVVIFAAAGATGWFWFTGTGPFAP